MALPDLLSSGELAASLAPHLAGDSRRALDVVDELAAPLRVQTRRCAIKSFEVIGVFLEDATIVAGPHHESHNDQ